MSTKMKSLIPQESAATGWAEWLYSAELSHTKARFDPNPNGTLPTTNMYLFHALNPLAQNLDLAKDVGVFVVCDSLASWNVRPFGKTYKPIGHEQDPFTVMWELMDSKGRSHKDESLTEPLAIDGIDFDNAIGEIAEKPSRARGTPGTASVAIEERLLTSPAAPVTRKFRVMMKREQAEYRPGFKLPDL